MSKKKSKNYKVGDVVLTETFASVKVHSKLVKRYIQEPGKGWDGHKGWYGIPVHQHELGLLKRHGVPVGTMESYVEDPWWIYDYQIIKKAK